MSNRTPEELAVAIGEAAVSVLKEELEVRRGKDEERNAISYAVELLRDKEPGILDLVMKARDKKIAQDFSADGYAVGQLLPTVISKWITKLLGGELEALEEKEPFQP